MSFASINGVTLHYRSSGGKNGIPLIFINSLGTSLHIWDAVIPLLDQGRPVLTYDLRGHGLSDAPPGPYSLDDYVADLLGFAARLGFAKVDLCGISIGGMIAIRAAATQSTQVRRLILCDTAQTIGTPEMWNDRIALVQQKGMAAVAETVLARWVSPGFRERRPAEFAGWRNVLERCPAEGYAASCVAVRDADLSDDLRHVSVPTLVIAGDHDVSTPPEQVRALADALAGARFRQLRGAGHVPAIEQPQALATLIREHLSEVVHV